MKNNFESVLNEAADYFSISHDEFRDQFSKYALMKMWSRIYSEEPLQLLKSSNPDFMGWNLEPSDELSDVFESLFDKLYILMSSARPFENVLDIRDDEHDLESHSVIKNLDEEDGISECTITDVECGSGSRLLSIIRYLYMRKGVSCLADKDIIVVSRTEADMRFAVIQILFHAHRNEVEIGKLAAHLDKGSEAFVNVSKTSLMTVLGIHNLEACTRLVNESHDFVIAETDHLLLLAA